MLYCLHVIARLQSSNSVVTSYFTDLDQNLYSSFPFLYREIEAKRTRELQMPVEEMVVKNNIRADSYACENTIRPHLNKMNY